MQQGSPDYLKAVLEHVEKDSDENAAKIRAALDNDKLRYVKVSQPVDNAGNLGKVQVDEFDLAR